jgi:hypothetical protein
MLINVGRLLQERGISNLTASRKFMHTRFLDRSCKPAIVVSKGRREYTSLEFVAESGALLADLSAASFACF